jgi:methylmalonyl-CoA mutase
MFQQFSPVTKAAWKAQIEKDLKGKPYEDLIWHLANDLSIEPFYQKEELEAKPSFIKPSHHNDWDICEWIVHIDQKEGNKIALDALMGGANALVFKINRNISAIELEKLLKDITLPYISTHFYYEGKKLSMAKEKMEHFIRFATMQGFELATLKGSLQIAPLGKSPDWQHLKAMLEWGATQLPQFSFLTINATEFHDSDRDVSEMLAKTIARGTEALEQLTAQGMSIEAINKTISFEISIGKSYFLTISKIRALKLLWLNVLKAYGVQNTDSPSIRAIFHPSEFNDDVNTNMIRATTMALSAAIGGVDCLTVLASDKKGETAFARRIARNVQHLLKMESYIDKVADPAAGAYYIEQMTDELAKKAWGRFTNL